MLAFEGVEVNCKDLKMREAKDRAENIFGNRVNITAEGQRHMGEVLGYTNCEDQYSEQMVDSE